MREALLGGLLGLGAGAASVWSLWWATGFAAQAARSLANPGAPVADRPTGWDEAPTNTRWDAETPSPTVFHAGTRSHPSGRSSLKGEPSPEGGLRRATFRLFLTFILKAPLLVLVAYGAQRLGTVALHWCVGGVVLVYSLAVFWAAVRTHRQ